MLSCAAPPLHMLKLLRISNIALVSAAELELGPGLTLLTGETGAGKSILIDALGLVLGARASSDLIRTGADRAVVEAVLESERARDAIERLGPSRRRGRGHRAARGPRVRQGPRVGQRRAGARERPARPVSAPGGDPRPARAAGPARPGHPPGRGGPARGGRPRPRWARRTGGCATSRRSSRRSGTTGARGSAGARCSSSRPARSRRPALRRGKRRSCARRRRCRPTPGTWRSCRATRTRCCTRTTTPRSHASGRCIARSRTSRGSTGGSRPTSKGATRWWRRSRSWPCSFATTRKALQVIPGRLDEIEARLALIERLKRKYGATEEEVLAFGERCRAELQRLASPEEAERALTQERRGRGRALPRAGARALRRSAGRRRRTSRRRSKPSWRCWPWRRRASASASTRTSRWATPPTPRAGPSGAWSRPSSCSRRTPARSCAPSRASPPAASSRGSCSP